MKHAADELTVVDGAGLLDAAGSHVAAGLARVEPVPATATGQPPWTRRWLHLLHRYGAISMAMDHAPIACLHGIFVPSTKPAYDLDAAGAWLASNADPMHNNVEEHWMDAIPAVPPTPTPAMAALGLFSTNEGGLSSL